MTAVALMIGRAARFGPGNKCPSFSPDGRDVLIVRAARRPGLSQADCAKELPHAYHAAR
jgi:hypothetical protein